MKTCSKCQKTKDESEFYTSKSWCKECFCEYCRERWKARKLKAVNLMGGKCCECGYRKNLASIDFHHLNPDEKEYEWRTLCKRPWNEIVAELKKCILVCRNCHQEIHCPDMEIEVVEELETDANARLNKVRYSSLRSTGICYYRDCENEVYGTKYCSQECAHLDKRKVSNRPTKTQLKRKLLNGNYSSVGREYEVSDNTIRKWAKGYGLI